MKATEFCYWLQGLFELQDPLELNEHQTHLIKNHLNMVFVHDIDPSYPEHQQKQLDAFHLLGAKPGSPPYDNGSVAEPKVLMRC